MVLRTGLVLAATAALSAFAVPASAALYIEAGVTPPAASVEVVPDRTYTYSYEPAPAYVEQRSYVVETPRYYYAPPPTYYYSEPSRVYVTPY